MNIWLRGSSIELRNKPPNTHFHGVHFHPELDRRLSQEKPVECDAVILTNGEVDSSFDISTPNKLPNIKDCKHGPLRLTLVSVYNSDELE